MHRLTSMFFVLKQVNLQYIYPLLNDPLLSWKKVNIHLKDA